MPWGDGTGPGGQGPGTGWGMGPCGGYGYGRGRRSETFDLRDELEYLKAEKEAIEKRLKDIEQLLQKEK